MIVTPPLALDDPTDLMDPAGVVRNVTAITAADVASGFSVLDTAGNPSKVNGYDDANVNEGRGARITNITGASAGALSKRCPHCTQHKPVADFGEPRTTNEVRDQSHCTECRGEAFQ